MLVFERRTVQTETRFEGLGLHSGVPVCVVIHPGNDGIWFRLNGERIQAHPSSVTDTSRCTILGPISTVEHVLSALAGCEITDAEIELDAPELPALDGAAGIYTRQLVEAGTVKVGDAQLTGPFARVFVHEKTSKVAIAAGTGHWRFEFESGDRWPHSQVFETEAVQDDFVENIAPARTFGFEEEIPMIQAAGLAKGLDLNTALVLGKDDYHNPPLFPLEPARHKMLDLIGDLSLAGIPIRYLNVSSERGGHWVNVKAAAILAENTKIEKI